MPLPLRCRKNPKTKKNDKKDPNYFDGICFRFCLQQLLR